MNALTHAALGITDRIKALTERPQSVTVRELIRRFMLVYSGRDVSLGQRLETWDILVGEFTLEKIDSDVIHAARAELLTLPALAFKGLDHEGKQVFRAKSRHRTKSPGTLNKYISAIGSLFTWAINERLTPRGWVHPCRGIKRLTEPDGRVRFLDAAERERLFAACKVSRYPRLYALTLTGITTGARRSELLGLKWCDMDLEKGAASLGRSKNGDRRQLVLLPQVVAVLAPFASTDANRYVFGSTQTRYQTPASIDTAWRHAIVRAKIKDFKFHDLRHCCASYLAQSGKPLNVIADVLGHRKLDMTRRYAHLTVQTKTDAMLDALGEIGA